MTAIESYLRSLRRHLWMTRALREERCEEIKAHLIQRESTQGHPFTNGSEIESLMGTDSSLARELNEAVPWWSSRIPKRLLLTPIAIFMAGQVILYVFMNLLAGVPGAGLLQMVGPQFVMYTTPLVAALYARRLCVRPLHAMAAISQPALMVFAHNAVIAFRHGEHYRCYGVLYQGDTLAIAMQLAALYWIVIRKAPGPWKGAGLALTLPVLPILASQLLLAADHVEHWDEMISIRLMAFTVCGVLIPTALFQRMNGWAVAVRNVAPAATR